MNHKEHKEEWAGIVLAVLALCFASVSSAQLSQQPTAQAGQNPTGNSEIGRETYTKKGCYACHGREGQGSPTTGPRLGPNPMPLATFTRYVRAPRGNMPPYSDKVVTDAELADMHAFLQARPAPAAIDSLLK